MNLQPSSPARSSQPLRPGNTAGKQPAMLSRQRLLRRAGAIRQQARSATDLWLAEQYEAAAELL
ncbi:hypothetical protein [Marinobacterium rhizophilum]|uniref:SAM-dependent methyltransferase n=1 Tax=Marinobacterium rhizophilum TaxID=420402 RepID=A0ABY5HND7_9GAMM|nr:hypothetical protein [Marinobacterium rhizophilum]UTW13825.1 hypothetical protein KDW95_09390 [Marinobacterium rhizophilum]